MTDDPGIVSLPPVPAGQADYQRLQGAGFTQPELDDWKAQQTQQLQQGGFTQDEIDAHWGNTAPQSAALDQHIQQNMKAYDPTLGIKDRLQAVAAGLDMSVTGLAMNGAKPDAYPATHTDVLNGILQSVSQVIGDLPAAIPGFFGGAAAGAAMPGVGETGVSEVAGAGFGAAALPQAMREIMLDSYNRGETHTFREFMTMAGKSVINTMKQGTIGAVTNLVGGPVAGAALKATGSKLVAGAAGLSAQAVTATSVAGALDGKVPDRQDFYVGAATLLGLHAAGTAVGVLRGGRAAPKAAQPGTPPGEGPIIEGEFTVIHDEPVGRAALEAAQPGTPPEEGPAFTGLAGGVIDAEFTDIHDEPVGRVVNNLQVIYRETGTPPWQVIEQARTDPQIHDEVVGQDVNGDPVAPTLREQALPPDPGYQSPAEKAKAEMTGDAIQMMAHDVNAIFHATAAPGRFARMAEQIDDTHTVPYGAGISQDGQTVYVDKNLPATIRVKRQDGSIAEMDPRKYLAIHEPTEYDAMEKGGEDYTTAHEEHANPAERAIVEHDGWNWTDYNNKILAEIAKVSAPEDANDVPKDLYEKPYVESGQEGLVHRHGPGGPAGDQVAGRVASGQAGTDVAAGGAGGQGGVPPGGGGNGAASGQVALPGKGPKPIVLNAEMLNSKLRDNVGTEEKSDKLLDLAKEYRGWINELGPARAIDKMLAGKGVTPGKDVGIEDMFRQTYASQTRLGLMMRHGGINPVTLDVRKDVPPAMAAVKLVKANGGNLADWENYLLAQRSIGLHKRGIDAFGGKFSLEDSQRLVEFGKGKYQDATDSLMKTDRGVLEYARDSGFLSQEQVDRFTQDGTPYINMRRMMGEEQKQPGRRGLKPGAQPNAIKGSDKMVVDPLKNTVSNWGMLVRNADRNRAVGAVVSMDDGSRGILGLKQIPYTPEYKAALAEPGSDAFKPYGIDDPEPYAPLIANRARRNGLSANQFVYYRNGKPELWQADSPLLAELLRGADSPSEAGILDKTMTTAARMARLGISLAPDFGARVLLRHQITAFIADPLHPPPFVTWARGIFDSLSQGDRYYAWVAKGGAGASLAEMDQSYVTKDMENLFQTTGVWDRTWNVVKSPLHLVQWIMERNDAAARIGYAKRAEGLGYTPVKAATMGRQAYIDYAQKGTYQLAGMLARWTPFLRPHLLGVEQTAGAFKKRPFETAGAALLAVTVPVILGYGLAWLQDKYGGLSEDQKYANVPRWQKDQAYPLPSVFGVRPRLAFPFQTGVPFGGLTVRFLDHFSQSDPEAFEGWLMTEFKDLLPPLPILTSPLVEPPVEAIANYNFFTGHSMIPSALEGVSGDMQYVPSTTEPAKALSRVLGPRVGAGIVDMSPITMENLVKGWAGTLGMTALKALNVPFKAPSAPWELSDIPFVQSFIVRNPGMSAQPIQDYFDELKKFETAKADKDVAMARAQKAAPNMDEVTSTANVDKAYVNLSFVTKALHTQSAVVQGIANDKTMTDAEKRQAIDRAYSDMIMTAKDGLRTMRSIK